MSPGARVERVLLAEPRGFCAGVEMAIKALVWMVRVFEPPVYCYHEIVHNRLVVERFRAQGVVFVDSVDEVPAGAPLMLSAHGSAPEVVAAARERDRFVVNAVCPLVTKVHHEAKVRAQKGYTILYVGHAGHDEAEGTLAVAPERDAPRRARGGPRRRAPRARGRPRSRSSPRRPSRCTTGRASSIAPARSTPTCGPRRAATSASPPPTVRPRSGSWPTRADAIVVIGSANSSNTLALVEVARKAGCARVMRVDGPDELDAAQLDGVRVVGRHRRRERARRPRAARSSTRLDPSDGVEPVYVTDEDEYFPPPRELRELLPALDAAAALLLGADPDRARALGGAFADDRDVDASDALAGLASPAGARSLSASADHAARLVEAGLEPGPQLGVERRDRRALHRALQRGDGDRLADHDRHRREPRDAVAPADHPVAPTDARRARWARRP